MNLKNTIIPKGDQLNADDLIAGPLTITIAAVESGSAEQPVTIRFKGDNGRPYKPSKSMRRVLVVLWGDEGDAYVGKRLELYRDPQVKFGADAVGGIKISRASGIEEPLSIALTEKRGKRVPHRVEPLPAEKVEPQIDVQALSDVGETKAREGTAAFRAWWGTLSLKAKAAITPKTAEWKQLAESADAGRAA